MPAVDGQFVTESSDDEPGDYRARVELRLAVGIALPGDRPLFAALLSLDERLSAVARLTQEPVFAQMRLAWWRDELARPAAESARDPLLTSLRHEFGPDASGLVALVDGWEARLVGDRDAAARVTDFANGRGAAFALMAHRLGWSAVSGDACRAGELWALASMASGELRDASLAAPLAAGKPKAPRLPRRLRPMALLAALSARALRRGGAELLGDRLSPLAALRIALTGR